MLRSVYHLNESNAAKRTLRSSGSANGSKSPSQLRCSTWDDLSEPAIPDVKCSVSYNASTVGMCAVGKVEWDWWSRCFAAWRGPSLHSFTSSSHGIREAIMTTDPVSLQTERVTPSLKPQEISFPLPRALHTTGHVHLTVLAHCATVFLSTSTPGDSSGSIKPLGSFVYAMPDVSFDKFLVARCLAVS